MTIVQLKKVVNDGVKKAKANYEKIGVAVGVAMLCSPASANVDVSDVVEELKDAKTPIASVAAASLGAYVAIRVWKLVRKAI